ncbi:CAAX amino terminal protease self- immunity [Caulifigura coniformis]|uniref:CAAX amino terminal protease self-immunity n=1 Tax=Caulifigura coniformis TaxID=2527983 RepID=A0A517S8M3_9PLAN|nr:CPBP family intramembrane glutamic endopeptidase [Caulifigura coniformis]QDT52470.1 CAAX amino terminal protease self- immunity [Caulifigura coniformis]
MTSADFPRLGRSRGDLSARVIALLVVISDSRIFPIGRLLPVVNAHTFIVVGLMASLFLSDGNSAAHGLLLRPRQGWDRWGRFALLAAGVILLLGLFCVPVWWLLGWPLPVPQKDPQHWQEAFYWMCVVAPVYEEIVYRMLLTIALLPILGDRCLIFASGILFGWIHIRGGNPGPDNLIAGFFLQWAYLRSGTLLVPMAMHAAGNALALSSQLVNWHLFHQAT